MAARRPRVCPPQPLPALKRYPSAPETGKPLYGLRCGIAPGVGAEQARILQSDQAWITVHPTAAEELVTMRAKALTRRREAAE
jgi:hypothetical protein